MASTFPACPLEVTQDEARAGFRVMVLDLRTYFGPPEPVQVVARKVSDSDVLIKMRVTSKKRGLHDIYEHIRFGPRSAGSLCGGASMMSLVLTSRAVWQRHVSWAGPSMNSRSNDRAGADGGMTVLFHAERACPAAAQHGRWPTAHLP